MREDHFDFFFNDERRPFGRGVNAKMVMMKE